METQTVTAAGAATKPSLIPQAPRAAGQPHLCPLLGAGVSGRAERTLGHSYREEEVWWDLRGRGGGREGGTDSVLPHRAV